jgi:hypothetical protein
MASAAIMASSISDKLSRKDDARAMWRSFYTDFRTPVVVRPLLCGRTASANGGSIVRRTHLIFLGCAAVALAFTTAPAQAQHRHGGGGHGGHVTVIQHSPLLWGGGFYGGFYSPYYFGFGQWYPPYPAFGYPVGVYNDSAVSIRLQVTPRDASVFVDGFAAGVVDDYDGVFQRLRLVPGPHEIVIHHPSHRTMRQSIYYNPGSTHTLRHALEPLAPGESPEPQPVPRAFPAFPGMPPVQSGAPQPIDPGSTRDADRAGTLVLRVQPGDATVSVDGEQWRGPQTQDRLVIQLREGPHRVRVEKPGFQPFNVDVDVRASQTTSFNVSLLAQ